MTHESRLHEALRQLAEDIRLLIDLSAHETEESWDRMIETVKKEIIDRANHTRGPAHEHEVISQALISEIYSHLGLLVKSLKDSQTKLRRLATRDLLTGLYNRNFFNETIIRDIQKAQRRQERLSFIIIDIDKFKEINDTYGHLHGDGVLRECAALLKRCVRASDFLCRYGGDEFVIVTPMPTCAGNLPLFERIAAALAEWNTSYASFDYSLSLSIGCAAWEPGRDVIAVLGEADREMYRDKQAKKR
jgi:diguanylate cyclase (GGDEF)-like protein